LSPNSGDILAVSLQKLVAHEQRGFTFAPIQGEGDPAAIMAIAVNVRTALVNQGEFQNLSKKTITAYQIGWLAGTSSKDAKLSLTPIFEIPDGLPSQATQKIPDQPFSRSLVRPGVRMVFFVSKVKFSDGTSWNADLKRLKKNALPGDSSVKSSSERDSRL
jgi:hypothetical protein